MNIRGVSCRAASACRNPGAAGGRAGGSWPSAGGATYPILDRTGTGARAGEHRPGTRRSQRAARAARSIRSPPRVGRASARPKICARNWRRQRRWPVGSRRPSGRSAGPNGPEPKRRWRASYWQNCAWRRASGRARGGKPVAKGRSRMKNRVRRRSPSTHVTATIATEIERADAIRWIRAQMLEYGLTME